MGKSIPVATGLLPAVAAVVGARYGVTNAACRLSSQGKLRAANKARENWAELKKTGEAIEEHKALQSQGRGLESEISQAYRNYDKLQRRNEQEVLKQTLLYSGGATAGAALLGQALESIRRATKGRAEVEPEEQTLSPNTLAPQSGLR